MLTPLSTAPSSKGHSDLRPLANNEVAEGHPVQTTLDTYQRAGEAQSAQLAPLLEDFLPMISEDTRERSMLLEPVSAPCSVDFKILSRGDKFPGASNAPVGDDELYSHGLIGNGARDRILELAAGLALKQPALSRGTSARFGHVNVLMYRGIFPLWSRELQKSVLLLVVAPGYVTAEDTRAQV